MIGLDLLLAEATLTSELVKYRLKEITRKIEVEAKVKIGTENLISASGSTLDVKLKTELEDKFNSATAKIALLTKAKQR